jgi:hypothetical protein
MEDLYSKFGDQIYIIYSDLLDADVLKDAQDHKISCKTGITINGKSQFILPERGLKGTVMLDGPTGQKNYDITDIEAIVQHILDTPELDEPRTGHLQITRNRACANSSDTGPRRGREGCVRARQHRQSDLLSGTCGSGGCEGDAPYRSGRDEPGRVSPLPCWRNRVPTTSIPCGSKTPSRERTVSSYVAPGPSREETTSGCL